MATIEINDEYRITSDEHQWIVQRKGTIDKHGVQQWRSMSYHAEIDQATSSLAGLLLRLSDAQGMGGILAEIERIDRMITDALTCRMAA